MGQVLHGSAKTTHAIRAAIQRSQASIKELSERYDLNPKTVAKWRKRDFVDDFTIGLSRHFPDNLQTHSEHTQIAPPLECFAPLASDGLITKIGLSDDY